MSAFHTHTYAESAGQHSGVVKLEQGFSADSPGSIYQELVFG